jgi:hypothetical protein
MGLKISLIVIKKGLMIGDRNVERQNYQGKHQTKARGSFSRTMSGCTVLLICHIFQLFYKVTRQMMQSKVIMVPEMGTSTQYLSHSSFCHLEGMSYMNLGQVVS